MFVRGARDNSSGSVLSTGARIEHEVENSFVVAGWHSPYVSGDDY